jgi:hypothetical protein
MKLHRFFVVNLFVVGLLLAASADAAVKSFEQTYHNAVLPENEYPNLWFSGFGVETAEPQEHFKLDAAAIGGCSVYWSNDLQWLGFSLHSWASRQKAEIVSFEDVKPPILPLSASLILRLPKGQFRPYVGISPGSLMNALEDDQSLNIPGFLFGLSCDF